MTALYSTITFIICIFQKSIIVIKKEKKKKKQTCLQMPEVIQYLENRLCITVLALQL